MGFRTRQVTCEGGNICSSLNKPRVEESCVHASCQANEIFDFAYNFSNISGITNKTLEDNSPDRNTSYDSFKYERKFIKKRDLNDSNVWSNLTNEIEENNDILWADIDIRLNNISLENFLTNNVQSWEQHEFNWEIGVFSAVHSFYFKQFCSS